MSLLESQFSIAGWPDGCKDQPLAVCRKLQLSLGCNPKQLQDGLVDDDTRAVADRLKTFDHDGYPNTVHNGPQRLGLALSDGGSALGKDLLGEAQVRGRAAIKAVGEAATAC